MPLRVIHRLEPAPGDLPNPISINFENRLTLSGFVLDSQRIEPGGTIIVTLYWLPDRQLEEDYTFFAQLVDRDTTRWANQRRLGAKHGQFKLLVDDAGQLLGAHVLGHEAGDIINLFALAMKGGLSTDVFKEMMWAYPTLTSDTKYMV